jgi:hypothetical protein
MTKFPKLVGRIEGADYPPGPLRSALGRVASVASFAVLGASFVPALAPALGVAPQRLPEPLVWLAENKLYGLLGYMACNFIAQRLVATGAYEVSLNGELIYSALENGGAVPSVSYIAHLLESRGLMPSAPPEKRLQ